MYPKVSLLWVNYNSSDFKDVIKDSISSILDLDYPNYEFIAVDGGSNDDSPDYIEGLLKKSKINHKFIRQKRNLGLHSSWNAAYSTMSKDSKYFMLLNNDGKIYPETLRKFVERLEQDDKIGAINGVELRWNSKIIDHAGMFFDEMFITNPLSQGMNVRASEKKEHPVSVASAVLGMFRTSATRRWGEKLLEENMFRHFNETILGARLWTDGYKILFVPVVSGEHCTRLIKESRSFKRTYYAIRGWLTLLIISNSPYKNSVMMKSYIIKQFLNRLKKGFNLGDYKEAIKYYRDVHNDAKLKAQGLIKRKIMVDLYKIPHIKGFRYYWIFPRFLTRDLQPTKTFEDLIKSRSVYLPENTK